MLIKSPNKSHPFIKFFAPLLSIFILLISCSKPVQESANRETTAQEETAITLPEQNASESKEAGETKGTHIVAEDLEGTREAIGIEKNKPPIETERTKFFQSRADYAQKIQNDLLNMVLYLHAGEGASYMEAEKYAIEGFIREKPNTEITKVDSENRMIYCRQTLNLPSGKELIYNASYKFYSKIITFAYTSYELINKEVLTSTPRDVLNLQQVHGDIIEAKDDPNKNQNIKIFEDYINEYVKINPINEENKGEGPYTVLDYIKGNFTGSGKDEYIVLFTAPLPDLEINDYWSLPDRVHIKCASCFIIENNKIIKMYELPGVYGEFEILTLGDGKPSRRTIDDFGKQFSAGWVADFNQNGTNELFFDCRTTNGGSYFFSVEFIDNRFIKTPICDHMYIVDSINWKKSQIIFNTAVPGRLITGSFDTEPWWHATYQWYEKEQCYVFISEKQIKK